MQVRSTKRIMMNYKLRLVGLVFIGSVLVSCTAGPDDAGVEYAPNMYHSVPYEPLSQITDEEAGRWVNILDPVISYDDKRGADQDAAEYYNSNPNNPFRMTMLEPVEGTVRRGAYLKPRIAPDDYEAAAELLVNPLDSTEALVNEGKILYDRFCEHCHGAGGNGDGLVAEQYPGIANLNGAAYVGLKEGHIFQVITHGKGLMGAHGSQISEEDRWKIARYVKVLQAK